MKKVTPEEVEQIDLAPAGRKPNQHMVLLRTMGVGDTYLLQADEWDLKTDPSTYIGGYFRAARTSKQFSVRKTRDGSAYVITRKVDRKTRGKKR